MILGFGIVLSLIVITTCAGLGFGVAYALWIFFRTLQGGSDQ